MTTHVFKRVPSEEFRKCGHFEDLKLIQQLIQPEYFKYSPPYTERVLYF